MGQFLGWDAIAHCYQNKYMFAETLSAQSVGHCSREQLHLFSAWYGTNIIIFYVYPNVEKGRKWCLGDFYFIFFLTLCFLLENNRNMQHTPMIKRQSPVRKQWRLYWGINYFETIDSCEIAKIRSVYKLFA